MQRRAANTLFGATGDMEDRPTAAAVSDYLANSGMPNLSCHDADAGPLRRNRYVERGDWQRQRYRPVDKSSD